MSEEQKKHQLTEDILQFWHETNAFAVSLQSKSERLGYTFYDGPPFTSGDPHYGHLLQSIIKDMVPRWMTMRGYRVARKWGWDCHGIPAENFVNKELGITSRKQVEEEFGIGNYIEACRNMVNQVNDNWKRTIDRVGRWVDMDNAYFTMSNDFMESVICLFSDLYHRNLIYKGFKVLGYSRALGTALSNSEIAEGYEMRQDPAVTIKLPLMNPHPDPLPSRGTEVPKGEGDDAIEVVAGIVRDEQGRLLMIYENRHSIWFCPGGKIDAGETPADALKREMREELGVEVMSEKFIGHVKTVHKGKIFRMHYFEATISGSPAIQEPEKHGKIAWVEKIPSENTFGYVLKADDLVITDEQQLRHEFMDFHFIEQGVLAYPDTGEAPICLLPWTTTPWTLPANMFAAVHNDIRYVELYDIVEKCYFILAEACVEKYYKSSEQYIHILTLSGRELVGLGYTPLFPYYQNNPTIADDYKAQVHRVLHADFVTTENGTGVVHEAPAFGVDDYDLICTVFPRAHAQDWLFDPVNAYGEFTELVPDFAGQNVIEANSGIIKNLKERGLLVKQETINHSYPHCPRTGTPLIYKAIESWFVKEEELKAQTVPAAQQIHFVPENVKARFINGLETAPDRNISRTRFWGCPLPVWESEDGTITRVVGSLDQIYQLNKPTKQLTKLILVRHGRTDYNEKGLLDCADKARLSEQGHQQAHILVDLLADEQVDVIYCSPFTRCQETIKPFATTRNLQIFVDERLQEFQVPAFQDKSSRAADGTRLLHKLRDSHPIDHQSGESVIMVYERIKAVLTEIIKKHPGETIVICSHGHPLLMLRKVLEDFDYENQGECNKRAMPNNDDDVSMVREYIFTESLSRLDLHRPYIDNVTLIDPESGKRLHRIPEVLDCWFESGSMPYGQDHWMKKGGNEEMRKCDTTKRDIVDLQVILVDAAKGIINADDEYSLESFTLNQALASYLASLPNKKIVVTNASGEKLAKMQQLLEGYDMSLFSLENNPNKSDPSYFAILLEKYQLSPHMVIYFDHQCKGLDSAQKNGISRVFQSTTTDETIAWLDQECASQFSNLNSQVSFSNHADFIAEGLDQTRGRFRALHVLGHAYHQQNVFRNVLVTGMILAEDGKKMSKRLKNYPDPSFLLNQYGADALRLYLLSSPVVRAEPLRFSEKAVEQMLKDVIIPLQNVSNFLQMYAEVDQWKHPGTQVWFMRHAIKQKVNVVGETDTGWITAEGETIGDMDLPLAEEGFAQLTSPEFVEQVVRINPEVIISSDFLRATQTAEGVQKCMHDYLGKEVPIIITSDRGLNVKRDAMGDAHNTFVAGEHSDSAKEISQVYTELLQKYAGKRVLIVSHKRRFRYVWQRLCGIKEDINTAEAGKKYFLDSAQCVSLPLTPLHNELDQWIFAELHQTGLVMDTLLQAYNVESTTKTLMTFVDKLTNRRVRRSRRRFWAPGMEADKQQAYMTLYSVLHSYLRLAAPCMPFTTEHIRQQLAMLTEVAMHAHPSIHTEGWPMRSQVYCNHALMQEVAQIREIITGALYLRAKHQIKVKQPLQSLAVRLLSS